MVVGLTGALCSGKNLAADVLARAGWFVVDEDALGHEALVRRREAIVDVFGVSILDENGEISRSALGELVFRDPVQLARLEAIVHPWMVEETARLLSERTSEHAVIHAAILVKMGLHSLCDRVIVVRACFFQRLLRCVRRDGRSFRQIIVRMAAQRSLNRVPKGVDSVTVWNTGSRGLLERRIARLVP